MLSWDAATMMPPGGGAARGDQLAVLAGMSHSLLVAPAVGDDLAAAEAAAETDPWRAANLRLMRHAHTRATAMPPDLVEAQARANSACEKVWREARRQSDFALVRPHLEEVVRLMREAAAALAPALGLGPYDALMDGYQRGMRDRRRHPGVRRLRGFPAPRRCRRRKSARHATRRRCGPPAPFPVAVQEALCRRLSERLGLDFAHARLDRSAHPFSRRHADRCAHHHALRRSRLHPGGAGAWCTRPATRCTSAACRRRWARQPVGEAAGMAAHESQSLIVEMQACRSDAFLTWLGPQLHAAFGGDPAPYRPDNLARLWRRVERGFIRVDADEMTYPGACHPALPAGAGAGRGHAGGRPICLAPGTTGSARCSA